MASKGTQTVCAALQIVRKSDPSQRRRGLTKVGGTGSCNFPTDSCKFPTEEITSTQKFATKFSHNGDFSPKFCISERKFDDDNKIFRQAKI